MKRIILATSGIGVLGAGFIFGATIEIDPELSRIAAHVRATGHSFDAEVTDYELRIEWDGEGDGLRSATLRFDWADVKTGRDRRDQEMLEWLNYESHPTATFVVTDSGGFQEEEAWVRGDLAFHGAQREVEIPIELERENDTLRIRGRVDIDHRDWGLGRIRAFLIMTVDPVLEVSFELHGRIVPAED